MEKKILFIIPSCPAYRVPFLEKICREFDGISLLHFGNKKVFNENPKIEEEIGVFSMYFGIKFIKNLKAKVNNFETIIAIFDPHWANAFILPILNPKKKIIFWGHGFGKNKLINKIRLFLIRKAKSMIVYNEEAKVQFILKGVDKKKVFVAPNTIYVANSKDTSKDIKNSFIYVGRLQKRKKLEIFIEAFSRLDFKSKNFEFNIIGDGEEEKSRLLKVVNKYRLNKHVNFIDGTSDEKKLLSYFKSAFAYVSPGAVGLGVLHSFAYGVPVLTIKDYLHGPEALNIKNKENGFISESVEQYHKDIEITINNYAKMGNNSFFHYSTKRSLDIMFNGFIKAL